ncbi:hypothetical protein GW17_00030652 [Ensete ventricosum]|nr:hypothetical protein GW17_00030652 [Ensete ventricosum]
MAFWWPLVVLGVAFAVCRLLFMLIPHNVPSIEVDASDVLNFCSFLYRLERIDFKHAITGLLLVFCRISSRDTGKTMVDASLGEIMTTCEKITWLLSEGEKWLKPEYRLHYLWPRLSDHLCALWTWY